MEEDIGHYHGLDDGNHLDRSYDNSYRVVKKYIEWKHKDSLTERFNECLGLLWGQAGGVAAPAKLTKKSEDPPLSPQATVEGWDRPTLQELTVYLLCAARTLSPCYR